MAEVNPALQVAYTKTKSDRIKGILNQLQEEVPDEGGEEELMAKLLENEQVESVEKKPSSFSVQKKKSEKV